MNKAALAAGLPAAPPPTISVPNPAPETIVVSVWGGPPGPAGAPGAGVSLQGVAASWPPSDAPATGDLYVVPDPAPAGTPAGFMPGDGAVWSGTAWVNTGPLRGPAGESGPDGPEGPPGPGPSVFEGVDVPVDPVDGDLWLKPGVDPNGDPVLELNVYAGGAWKPVAGGGGGGGTVDTTGNAIGVTESQALALQTWVEEIHGAIGNRAELRTDVEFDTVEAFRLVCQAGAVIKGPLAVFGTIYYGGSPLKDADGNERSDPARYVFPTPTGDGYLRCDQDPAAGWYFAEPVIVSGTEPPAPAGGGAVWIDPTGPGVPDTSDGPLSRTNPLKYADPMVTALADGTLIGLSADGATFHQPEITGAIPVIIDGKRYLLPVIEE